MKSLLKILTEKFSDAFIKCGYLSEYGIVTISDRLDLCQFQCNGAFIAAKVYKKPPFVIADEIKLALKGDKTFLKIEVVRPGFINIIVSDDFLIECFNQVIKSKSYGINISDFKSETIVLDYGGPNIAKPLHIGHMRTAIVGETLKRLAKFLGHQVISDVHLGDWGLPLGLVIAELKERYPNKEINNINVNELNEIYPFASKKSLIDLQFKNQAQQITNELQNGNSLYLDIWKKIISVSIEDMKKNYSTLNVSFDYWYGESNSEKYIQHLLEQLEKRQLLKESEGALVVDVALENDKTIVPPIIIKKTNNASVYATTDLATIIQRSIDFKPTKIWYVVDVRQSLHFLQVFRCAKMAQLVEENVNLEHIAIGTINGSDGKPYKTRDGGVMQLAAFIKVVVDSIVEKMNKNSRVKTEERIQTAQRLAIAAVKFGDLVNYRMKDYIFDLEKFISPDGKTGIYILYTLTRIKSILNKIENVEVKSAYLNKIHSSIEREIIIRILLLNEIFQKALEDKAPNLICESVYQLSVLFTKFYHENHILNESDQIKKLAWVKLVLSLFDIINLHLDILGIDPVEVM